MPCTELAPINIHNDLYLNVGIFQVCSEVTKMNASVEAKHMFPYLMFVMRDYQQPSPFGADSEAFDRLVSLCYTE